MLLIAVLCVPWVTQAQGDTISSFPFTCNFEDAADSAHWSFQNASNGWFIGTATNNGGTHALYVSDGNGSTVNYSGSECVSYAYLTFDIAAAGQYAVQFDWKCAGESTYDFLRVAVSPAGTALPTSYSDWTSTSVPSNFIAVDGGSKLNLAGTSWNTHTSVVNVTAAGVYRLLFVWRNDGSVYNQPPACIDNVVVTELTCPQPTSLTVLPSSDQIDLSWNPGGSETEWMVKISDTVVDIVYDTFYTAYNLTPQTLYNIKVYAICGVDDTSMATSASIRTLCEPIQTLPYVQDFDNITTSTTAATGVQVPCWDAIMTGSATYQTGSYVPQIYYSSTYAHSGSYSYRLYGVGYHTLPPMPVSLDSLQLSFWDYTTSTSYGLEVGVMEGNTFVPIQIISTPASTHVEYTVYFGNYTGSSRVIAFRNYYTTSTTTYYSYHYLDNIEVDYIPNCPSIVSHNVVTTASAALINWSYETGLGITPDDYEVNYGYAADSLFGATNVTVNEPTLMLTGLIPDTSYMVSIVAGCTDGDSYPYTFTFSTKTLPCLEWDTTSSGPSSPEGTYVVGTPGTSTTNVMPVNGGYNYSYCNHLILHSDIPTMPTGTTYISGIDFQYAASAPMTAKTNCTIYMCHTTMTICDNFANPADFVLVYEGPLNCTTNGWNHFEFNRGTFAYNGTGNIIVAIVDNSGATDPNESFYYENIGTARSHRVYRDDAPYTFAELGTVTAGNSVWRTNMRLTTGGSGGGECMTMASCYAPAVTSHQDSVGNIYLEWIPGYQETTWDIDYRIVGTTSWTNAATSISSTNYTVMMSDLQYNTQYEIRVSANCTDTNIGSVVEVTTPCSFATLPIIENFDGITGSTATSGMANILPQCWDYYNDGTRTNYQGCPYVYSNTTYSHSGSNCIRFYSFNSSGDSNQYLILPPVDPIDNVISGLQLSFWLRAYSTSSNYFANVVVGVMTDPTIESSFIPYDTVSSSGVTTYSYHEINFNHYTGPQGRITLLFPKPLSSSQYEYGYIDDLMLGPIPECLSVDNLTSIYNVSDSIILSWNPGGSETQWEVTYDSGSFVVFDTFFVADNLNPNTEYTFTVRALCGGGDTSYPVSYTTRTDCGPISVLPYIESFEGLPVGASSSLDCGIPCWGRLDNASTYHFGYIGSPSSWPSGGHTGTGFVYYYMPTTTGTYADWIITILPTIDTVAYPLNTLQVSFWVKMNSATTMGDIQVGVISNINEDSTFVPVDTVHVAGNVYDLKTAYLSGYNGNGTHIALKFLRDPGTTTYYFLDDVTVEPIPDCPPVSNIVLSGLDSNLLTVVWSENGNATSWEVEYGVHGFTLGTGTTVIVNTTPSYTITGLTPNTEYDVYVTPVCTNGTSATRMGTFRTANTYVQLPLSCGFENASQNALWTLENGSLTNKWYIGSATNNGGSNSLYISDNNGTSCNYTISSSTVVFAYTDVMISTPGDYGYSFDWKSYGESSLDYIRAALVPASETFTAGTTLPSGLNATSMPSGWISLDGNSKLNLQTNWQTRSDVVSIASAGVYHLVFVFRCDGSVGTQPPAAIDNVELAHMTCPRPQNITLSNLTQTSVDISWEEVGNATSWQYQLGNNTPVIVTDTFCNLTNLTANTPYTFRVRSICGQGDTSFWMIYNFRTPCGYLALPYIEDFENESTGSSSTGSVFVNCWNRLNNGTSYGGYPYVSSSSTYNHTNGGSKGLYWYNTTTMGTYGDYLCAVLPPVDPTVGVDSLQLSFWAKASSASYTPVFQIGVMTDPNNISTFVGVDTVTVTSGTSWMQVEVPLVSYTGNGQYVAVKVDRASAWTAYTDDFILEYVPTCLIPHNVIASEASTTSITVDWTDQSAASEWEIRYRQNGTNTNTSVTTSSHPYTISGLDTLTSYIVEVRAICTVGDTSRWSTAVSLSTEICDNAVAATTGATNGTGYLTPVNNYYKYTLSETIIDSAELAGIGDIMAIAYSYAYSTASTDKTDVTIWLQPTTKTAFSSSSDIELLDTTTAVQVYSGHLNCTQGWNYFAFDTLYTWDGHSNLMVIVDDNSNDYNGSAYVFNTSSCSEYKTLVWYSDSYNADPLSSSYSGSKVYHQYRATMKLVSCGAGCSKPILLPVTDLTYQSATINWNNNATDFEIAVKAATDAEYPAPTAVSNATSYAVSGLAPATLYRFHVRAVCDAAENLVSDWIEGTFTTDSLPCFDPTELAVQATGYTTATLGWTANGEESAWRIRVWNTTFDQTYDVTSNPATVTGLVSDVEYSAEVLAVCGGVLESGVSNTVTFRTARCEAPTNVTSSNITAHTAVVSWSGDASSYRVEYGTEGFGTGEGTSVTATGTTVTLTDLLDDQTYDVYVYAVCAEGLESAASQKHTFETTTEGIDIAGGMNVSIYPNPTTSATTVALSGVNGEVTITVVDMNGRVVKSETVSCDGDCTKRMDVEGLAQGAYFVRVSGENLNMVKKLVVK